MRIAGLVFTVLALSSPALAFTGSGMSATAETDSLAFGTGVMVNAGYFFKDTMFSGRGRGGFHADCGKAFPLGGKFGFWAGAGALRASGTFKAKDSDGNEYDTHFNLSAVHADLGLLTPWTPFPVGIMVYKHWTDVSDTARSGPYTGDRFSGSESGFGWGIAVHILFEWFPWESRSRAGRGPGLVLGYMGLIDMSKIGLETANSGSVVLVHKGWKPVAGESLRAGLEWEF